MKRCPKCKKDFPDDANFCPADAAHLLTVEDSAPQAVADLDSGGDELVGGRFVLGERLGGSRTGPVCQATDREGDKSVVVKLVEPSVFPSEALRSRTVAELDQLKEPVCDGVVQVIAHGIRNNQVWIATQKVDGVTLDALLSNSGSLPQSRAVALVLRIGEALEQAAKLGVIHRDVAPKNILVGDNDQVHLINFGIPVPGDKGRESIVGVPQYLAPEQIDGRPIDQRCTIYSLGAIATLLLTGKPLFVGTTVEILDAHTQEEVGVLGSEEGVSDVLARVIQKSLEKSSSKRFMTLRQFLDEVRSAESEASSPNEASGKASGKSAQGKGSAARTVDVKKTLMGVSAAELQSAMKSAAEDSSAAKGLSTGAESSSGAGQREPMGGETSLDHTPPSMSDAQAVTASAPADAPTEAHKQQFPSDPGPITGTGPTQETPYSKVAEALPLVAASAASAASAPSTGRAAAGGKRAGTNSPRAAAEAVAKKSKGKFRETMWFKKGELDEAAARAAAKAKPDAGLSSKADEMEMDVRYSDDGSITEQDKDRLSLRTGETMMMEAINTAGSASGVGGVSEQELISEMTSGRNKVILVFGVAAVALAIVLVIALL